MTKFPKTNFKEKLHEKKITKILPLKNFTHSRFLPEKLDEIDDEWMMMRRMTLFDG